MLMVSCPSIKKRLFYSLYSIASIYNLCCMSKTILHYIFRSIRAAINNMSLCKSSLFYIFLIVMPSKNVIHLIIKMSFRRLSKSLENIVVLLTFCRWLVQLYQDISRILSYVNSIIFISWQTKHSALEN